MIKSNGGIIGPDNVTTGGAFGTASGVFKLGEVTDLIKESKWPTAGPQGYQSANSCRFNDGSSDNLSRTQESSANSQIFTYSTWVKRSGITGAKQEMASGGSASTDFDMFYFDASERLSYYSKTSNSENLDLATTRVFRDVSAWYHIVLSVDTTQGTASNRIKLYVNGVQETSFATGTYPSVNTNLFLNKASQSQRIGRQAYSAIDFFDGYMAETVLIDGSQLAPTSFGEENSQTGIWVPKVVTGLTFGTNGFYLSFTNASALGEDFSGNDNDFTVNNLTSIDQSTDTCSTNFATLNPLDNYYFGGTFSNGNITALSNSSGYSFCTSTMGVSSGKWYVEAKWDSGTNLLFGVTGQLATSNTQGMGNVAGSIAYGSGGARRLNGAYTASWGDTYSTGDILSIALDLDNNKAYFAKNGTYQNSSNPSTGSNGETITSASDTVIGSYFFGFSDNSSSATSTVSFNFGSPPFAISSGNTDGNGFGNFEYAVPSGYLSLNTKNLAAVLA